MYLSTKASISNTDGSYEAEEEAVLQGTLHAKVLAALQWLKLNNPLYKDVQINSDWVSDTAEVDTELWEALSTERCPPPSSPLTSSQSTNGEHLHMLIVNICFLFPCNQS